MVRASRSISRAGYDAARQQAAVIDRSHRGRIVLKGKDRGSFLQGLLTNDVAALSAGAGCYAALLTPQGRMITDLWVYEIGDFMLLALPGSVKDAVLEKLDGFVFAEDVQLNDVSDTFTALAVVGPKANAVVESVVELPSQGVLAGLSLHGNLRATYKGEPVIVVRVDDTGEPGYELFAARSQHEALVAALHGLGAVTIDEATADVLRIEAGIPVFHRDMDEETIPLEAGIESRAISQTKGCYVGQEVIVRVLHRGHGRVARRLVGLTLEGTEVPSASEVTAGDRSAGETTSATWSVALDRPIALAYLHRDFTAEGTPVAVGGVRGVVRALPFVPRS